MTEDELLERHSASWSKTDTQSLKSDIDVVAGKEEDNQWAGASHAILPFLQLGRQVSRVLYAGCKPVTAPKQWILQAKSQTETKSRNAEFTEKSEREISIVNSFPKELGGEAE